MNKNLTKVIYLIIIFILLFININIFRKHVIYIIIKSNNEKIQKFIEEKTETSIFDKKSDYINGVEDFYKSYKGNINKDELQRVLYNFTNSTISEMIKLLNKKSTDEIKEIYRKQNQNDLKIYTEEIYIKIWKEIKTSGIKDNSEIVGSNLETRTMISTKEKTDVKYQIILTNNRKMQFLIQIPTDNKSSISISNYDESLQSIKRVYKGLGLVKPMSEKIDNFKQTIINIQKALSRQSENKKAEYYDTHKEKIANSGITSVEDYKKIVSEIFTVNWKDNVVITDIDIVREPTNKDTNTYQDLTLYITTSNYKTLKFNLKLGMTDSIQPNVIITAIYTPLNY
jgi:hypothetical protein